MASGDALEYRLREAEKTIERLRGRIDELEAAGGAAGLTLNGRPVLTLAQAAARFGVTYHTARRRCEDGEWDAAYVPGDVQKEGARQYGTWYVYAEQAEREEQTT
jgi:hypothetical protein